MARMAINCIQLHLMQPFTHATKITALETMPYYIQLLTVFKHTQDDYILHGACKGYVFKHLDPTL